MSFFSRWKNLYLRSDVLGQNPEGRYFAICLAEALRESQKLRNHIAGRALSSDDCFQVRTESSFEVQGRKRYGDVAFLRQDGTQSVLLEVKMEDDFHQNQLRDYINYCRKRRIHLLVTTKYPLRVSEELQIQKSGVGRHLLLSDLVGTLLSICDRRTPISQFLLDYVREENMFYEPSIDREALDALMTRLFWPRFRSGGRKQGNERMIHEIPQLIHRLMSNVKIVGSKLFPEMSFGYDYSFIPYVSFEPKKLQKALKVSGSRKKLECEDISFAGKRAVCELDGNWGNGLISKAGGAAYFYGQARPKHGAPWPCFLFGYKVWKEVRGDRPPVIYPYIELFTTKDAEETLGRPLAMRMKQDQFETSLLREARSGYAALRKRSPKMAKYFEFIEEL